MKKLPPENWVIDMRNLSNFLYERNYYINTVTYLSILWYIGVSYPTIGI